MKKFLGAWISRQLRRAYAKLNPVRTPTPPTAKELELSALLAKAFAPADPEEVKRAQWVEKCHELYEARQMTGAGPWLTEGQRSTLNRPGKFQEAFPFSNNVGATGDLDLMIQNIDWRREINFSLLEFSRWGIQQIILISRLYYLKHPWIRRGINLSAAYVFGQGVELSSPDPAANDVLKRFVEKNKGTLGQIALTEAEKRKSYDGNLFYCVFPDRVDTGEVSVRLIDATEMQDIITDPDDASREWYYRRTWVQRIFDERTGEISTKSAERWYPALNYEPDNRIDAINGIPVEWESPVYHRKVGAVASWIFGCPRIYPALDWAKEGRKFLESFASVWQALHQIAIVMQTKGGQQAIAGIKNQLQTSVGPPSQLWDVNPNPVAGSTFASGPGTTMEAFNMKDAGGDPGRIKEFRNMVACCLDIPPTWLGDMETSNLSTAQTLDRPTELGFLLKQEEWQEDLVVLGRFALEVSKKAPSGKLKEAYAGISVKVVEAARYRRNGHWVYEAKKKAAPDEIEVLATFPAIREGDAKERMDTLVQAATLGNKGGQFIGIDEKEFVRRRTASLTSTTATRSPKTSIPTANTPATARRKSCRRRFRKSRCPLAVSRRLERTASQPIPRRRSARTWKRRWRGWDWRCGRSKQAESSRMATHTLNAECASDPCCAKPLAKAAKKGELDGKAEWECPRCGCLWTSAVEGDLMVWSPVVHVAIFLPSR